MNLEKALVYRINSMGGPQLALPLYMDSHYFSKIRVSCIS